MKSFDASFFQPIFFLATIFCFLVSCGQKKEKRFTLLSTEQTGVDFENKVEDTPEFSILNYPYFYDGGGVAVGDIDNNGLPDLFFTGNKVHNRLYLNKGNFHFEDITEHAGITDPSDSWSTGVTMADVNGDGFLDIYVCKVNYLNKSGANQLFINNGDGIFTEQASDFGLDFTGYSTQAVFFDYNRDGRLDLFLLNHSFHSERTYGEVEKLRAIPDSMAGDRLFRNDGDRFTDVTEEAGIYSSALGYGLGVAVSDINQNGWPDIYVGNDFYEDDYLYINNGDGTFTESLYSMIGHTSSSSMGNDIADFTNDGYVDIVSLDMLPEDRETFMHSWGPGLYKLTKSQRNLGFGPKNAKNTLQFNRGSDRTGKLLFSEIAYLSGVARTDWSWAALFVDMNNSGWKDLFVTNGMVRRPNDLDFIRARNFNRERIESDRKKLQGEILSDNEMEMLDYMPQLKISNYIFRNNRGITFSDSTVEWGLNQPSYSTGAAYTDLNMDGRMDLVVNNINMPSFVYRNNTSLDDNTRFLKVRLHGPEKNRFGIGSKVVLYNKNKIFYQEQIPTRGFQSSVDHILHFGLGAIESIDSLLVIWSDGRYNTVTDVETNQAVEIYYQDTTGRFDYSRLIRKMENVTFKEITSELRLEYQHTENDFNDFKREPLMPYKLSSQGPALAVEDITGNGLDDFYIGGAHGQAGRMYLQQSDGQFVSSNIELFERDKESEDVDAVFFDATGDGRLDLYVVSGGGEMTGNDDALRDRMYINLGKGEFMEESYRLPEIYSNGAVVRAADFDNNGTVDLFVGTRSIPFQYGISPKSFLLENDGTGVFRDVTEEVAPTLLEAGMVTDARWFTKSGNSFPDLIIAGEWMPLRFFKNNGDNFTEVTDKRSLSSSSGLWQSIFVEDLNSDGHPDIIAGNFGTNTRLKASKDTTIRLYLNDFNEDGLNDPVITTSIDGNDYPFEQLDVLLFQLYNLTDKVKSYRDFASRTISGLFGKQKIRESIIKEVTELESVIFMNEGNGTFRKKKLPKEVQFSPVMSINSVAEDSSGILDILLGGNLYDVRPSFGGQLDASFGSHLRIKDKDEYRIISFPSSGFVIRGEVREIRQIQRKDDMLLIVAQNNRSPLFFKYMKENNRQM